MKKLNLFLVTFSVLSTFSFAAHGVDKPPEKPAISAPSELQELTEATGKKLADRRSLAVKAAKALDTLLPKITDSETLLKFANQLSAAVLQGQTEMEFFGENPIAQAQLKPVVLTSKRMFKQVGSLAAAEVQVVGNKVKTPKDYEKVQPLMDKLQQSVGESAYTDNMSTYPLCLSLPADDPDRKTQADQAISYLKDFDNHDSGVQPQVRMQTAKLFLVQGDNAKAKETFDTLVNNPDKAIVPTPDLSTQNLARYFGIVAEIKSRKLPAAEQDIAALENWQLINFLPSLNAAGQLQIKSIMAMLKFRLYTAQSDLANDDQIKKETNDKAMNVLAQLLKEQPNLKDLVFDQLVARVPDSADLTTLNPLILQGRRQMGFDEVKKQPEEKVDEKKLGRAIDAAKEIVNRKGQPGVDDADVNLSAYFLGYAYERLNQPKPAAGAFMDYAHDFYNLKWKDRAEDALDHAQNGIIALRKKDAADPETRDLYDRFLPVAIGAPYNRKIWAYRYASLLEQERKYKEAVDFFKLVDPADKQYADAQFHEMLSLTQELASPSVSKDDRTAMVEQILLLAKNIDGAAASASAASEDEKKTNAQRVVVADEVAAELARSEMKNPAMALQILEGFEARVLASKDPAAAHIDALQIRINAFVDQDKIDDAFTALFSLLEIDETKGQALMFEVSHTIDRDMEAANVAGDKEKEGKLALDQAQLSSKILEWAIKSKDPKVQEAVPNYQRFSADSKRKAAVLVADPAVKKAQLLNALKDYQELNRKQPDNLAAQQGIGYTAFDLDDYELCIKMLAPLVEGKKVGNPWVLTGPAGAQKEVENIDYWQANYELVKSLVERAKKNPKDPKGQQDLKDANLYIGSMYITYGKRAGGTTYRAEFEKLKAELATQAVK